MNRTQNTQKGNKKKQVKGALERLGDKITALLERIQQAVQPVALVGTIGAALYSVIMVPWTLGSQFLDWEWTYVLGQSTLFTLLMAVLFFLSLAGLIATGGIIEVLRLFWKALCMGIFRDHFFAWGNPVAVALTVALEFCLTLGPLAFVLYLNCCAPIVPILIRMFRSNQLAL